MSLTPQHRSDEAASESMQEGLIAGGLVLAPTLGGLYVAMKKSSSFVARTNWQSRTAIAIMPALFTFALSSERHLDHKMRQMAQENQHHRETVEWAEIHHRDSLKKQSQSNMRTLDKEINVMDLYRKSVEESGVNIVPGNALGFQHKVANYISANPTKVLAGLAVPSVALIYYGNAGKEHLQFSTKLLHTRVFGQAITISLMLSIMGFKDYMDRNGQYITEVEAGRRVEEMGQIRQDLIDRLDYEEEQREVQESEIIKAHEEVLKKKQMKKVASPSSLNTMTATSPN